MEKFLDSNPDRPSKQFKNRKKRNPIKVVHISNPIKFQTSASQFRELVQKLTGKDADYSSETFAGGEAACAKAESHNAHSVVDEVAGTKIGQGSGSDPLGIGSGLDDGYYGAEMFENLVGLSLIEDMLQLQGFDGIQLQV